MYHGFCKLSSIYIYLVFSIYYLVFSTLSSGKQVLYITKIIMRICFFKSYPSENITDIYLDFSNFVHDSLSENLIAVHLGFSNFMHGSLSENLTAVHLGFSNFMHGCRACGHAF